MPRKPPTYRPNRTRSDGTATPGDRRPPDTDRPTAAQRGYGSRWQTVRLHVLADVHGEVYPHGGPLCRECQKRGLVVEATVVDHHVPHRGDQMLMWQETNLVSLCKPCHDRKTALFDGAFGRLPRAGAAQPEGGRPSPPPGPGGHPPDPD